ncbi:MAG: zinc metallopeptidase [Bacteroidetes bacterium]|nr:zinc metallopeptidase [Bacteroidota bacterium]
MDIGLFPILIVFMIISWLVGMRLKSKFTEYSKIPTSSGLSGAEVAEKMLRENRIFDVQVTCVDGQLTDHYNPVNKTINLSRDVYQGRNVAAAAVAAHECGHAVQHATAYALLQFRTAIVPVVNFSSTIMNFIFIASMFMGFMSIFNVEQILWVIVIAQGAITLFSLVTLPVEIDASNRALVWLEGTRITRGVETDKAKHALRLAGYTYMIAALAALTTLIYFILRLLASRRD